MKSNPGDLYILQDGTQADAGSCSNDDKGVLRHENGLAVLVDSKGEPLTVAQQAEEGGAALAAAHGRAAAEGEPLATTENQAGVAQASADAAAASRQDSALAQAMVPAASPAKPDESKKPDNAPAAKAD